jgi:hypothetical protein
MDKQFKVLYTTRSARASPKTMSPFGRALPRFIIAALAVMLALFSCFSSAGSARMAGGGSNTSSGGWFFFGPGWSTNSVDSGGSNWDYGSGSGSDSGGWDSGGSDGGSWGGDSGGDSGSW